MKNLFLIAFMVVLSGCAGYKTGNIKHPQIDTVGVAAVQNATNRPELRVELQKRLRAAVQSNGSYKLKGTDGSDCVVHARIVEVRADGVGAAYRSDNKDEDSNEDYGSTIYRVTLQVEYTVLIPGQARPLIPLTKVSGQGRFTEMGDIEVARRVASGLAATDASQKIIAGITEAW